MKHRELEFRHSSETNEQMLFEEEMHNLEQEMQSRDEREQKEPCVYEHTMEQSMERQSKEHKKKTRVKRLKKPKESIDESRKREINRQIFGIQQPELDFLVNKRENSTVSKMEGLENTKHTELPWSVLKEAVQQYKKSSKCLFLGSFMVKCTNKRKAGDDWYHWPREMVEGIDHWEGIMNNAILEYGHERVEELFQEKGGDDWNSTLGEKVEAILDGVKSIEEMIENEGMTTIWGKIKKRGVLEQRIRGVQKRGARVRGLISYMKYKCRKWDTHYKKVTDKIRERRLYH